MSDRSKSNLVRNCLFISNIQGVAFVVVCTVVRYCNKIFANLWSSGKVSFVSIALLKLCTKHSAIPLVEG